MNYMGDVEFSENEVNQFYKENLIEQFESFTEFYRDIVNKINF